MKFILKQHWLNDGLFGGFILKSENLQYNTLVRWDERLINQASDVPSIIFFHNFFQKKKKKSFQFIFWSFYSFTKMKTKSFESIRNYEKNNAWNIRCLADKSFIPGNQRTSILYCRLSDFTILKVKPP